MSQYTLEYVVYSIIREQSNYSKGILDVEWRPVDAFFLHRTQMLHQAVVGIYCLTNSTSCELEKDDIILSIDGTSVQGSNAASILWRTQPNDVVQVQYVRPGSDTVQTAQCTLKAFSPQEDVVQLGFVQASKYLIQPKKMEMEDV
jgi:PDZ domain-containing secreted protein